MSQVMGVKTASLLSTATSNWNASESLHIQISLHAIPWCFQFLLFLLPQWRILRVLGGYASAVRCCGLESELWIRQWLPHIFWVFYSKAKYILAFFPVGEDAPNTFVLNLWYLIDSIISFLEGDDQELFLERGEGSHLTDKEGKESHYPRQRERHSRVERERVTETDGRRRQAREIIRLF